MNEFESKVISVKEKSNFREMIHALSNTKKLIFFILNFKKELFFLHNKSDVTY